MFLGCIEFVTQVSSVIHLYDIKPKANAQECRIFLKPFKRCHVGIHWKALAEYSQMSTHVPGFWSFLHHFVNWPN